MMRKKRLKGLERSRARPSKGKKLQYKLNKPHPFNPRVLRKIANREPRTRNKTARTEIGHSPMHLGPRET